MGGSTSKIVKDNVWSLVSPDKVGRTQTKTPRREKVDIQISASKFSLLSLDDAEESEIHVDEQNREEKESNEEDHVEEYREEDIMEDELLERKVKEHEKAVVQKGGSRVQKAKAHDVNPKGKRSSRRNL